ncbi:MAG TPA: hypothetical protein VJT75_08165 [Thermoleophilaceae bacterium]|nr:hypothetical protein [Thermoleophilaceae bacterium]
MTITISGKQAVAVAVALIATFALAVAALQAINPPNAESATNNDAIVAQLKQANSQLGTISSNLGRLNRYIGLSNSTFSRGLRGESHKYASKLYGVIYDTCRALAATPSDCPTFSGP